MINNIGKKVLITSVSWFFAPDGKQYKAVFGTLKVIHTSQETLGFTPSRTHTNWYLEVGNMNLAGCQVLHLVQANEVNTNEVVDFTTDRTHATDYKEVDRKAEDYLRPSYIYRAE